MTCPITAYQLGTDGSEQLQELDALGRLAISCLRDWDPDPSSQSRIAARLADGFGSGRGRSTLDVFNELMDITAQHGNRSLACYGCGRDCLGTDEARFARMISAADSGDIESATHHAEQLVCPKMARPLAEMAGELAQYLAITLNKTSAALH